MQTILERYKTLPDANAVPDAVTDAHELEHAVARAIRDSLKARAEMQNVLAKDWTPKEVIAAGLTTPRNPREIMFELVHAVDTAGTYDVSAIRRLAFELDCTFEPYLAALPPHPRDPA